MAIDTEFLKSIGIDDEEIAAKLVSKTAEDEQGLVSKRDELLDKVTKYKAQLSGYEGVDVDEYKELKRKLAELDEKDLMNKGDFETIKQRLIDEYEAKLAKREENENGLKTQLENYLVGDEIGKAINAAKGNAKLLTPLIKQRLNVVDDNGKLSIKVLDDDGKTPSINSKGDPMTIAELVESMKADESYAAAFDSSGLSGGGVKPGHNQGGEGDDKLFGSSRMAAARSK